MTASRAHVVRIAALAAVLLAMPASVRAFFVDADNACAVHNRRDMIAFKANDPGALYTEPNLSYRELCNPDRTEYQARGLFDPFLQYGSSLSRCLVGNTSTRTGNPASVWPVCVQNPLWVSRDGCNPVGNPSCLTDPDMGYRYPRVVPPQPGVLVSGIYQNPGEDWWPICVAADGEHVLSDPLNDAETGPRRTCPVGLQEVGRCVAAAHYFEKLDGPGSNSKMPAARFFSFVMTKEARDPAHPTDGRWLTSVIHTECETRAANQVNCSDDDGVRDACAHDVLSAVTTCRLLCSRYFGQLRYVRSSLRWQKGTTASLATEQIKLIGHCNEPPGPNRAASCFMTPLDLCINNCGPPFTWIAANGAYVQDDPPWVTKWTNRPANDRNNHWYFVNFGRNWNPNEESNHWLRSYANNRDKEQAPAAVCQDAVNKYCNLDAIAGPYGSNGNAECRDEKFPALPQAPWDYPVPPGDLNGDTNLANDGFCDHFFRSNYLCPQTCISCGTDCDQNPRHVCGDEALIGGMLGLPGPCEDQAYENGLDELRANTCCDSGADPICSGEPPLCQ